MMLDDWLQILGCSFLPLVLLNQPLSQFLLFCLRVAGHVTAFVLTAASQDSLNTLQLYVLSEFQSVSLYLTSLRMCQMVAV